MDDNLESQIKNFARDIFKRVGEEQPSTFNRKGLSGKLMQWSMSKPELKTNLFRLVDVLPALQTSKSIATHAAEYLKAPLAELKLPVKHLLREDPGIVFSGLTSKAVKYSVLQMAKQFIAGNTPQSAKNVLKSVRRAKMAFTVDLLGEYSVSEREALKYLDRYLEALDVFHRLFKEELESGEIIPGHPGERSPNCISVKLTALYSQCGPMNYKRSVDILSERLAQIAIKALEYKAAIYVDAEDTANNPIIYDVFKRVFGSGRFVDFPYPGIVLQAYAKSSEQTLDDLLEFAKKRGGPIAVRLVKGAYWDHETIISGQQNWPSPLFSLKESSDANFEKLSRILVDNAQFALPAFASHNIRSLSFACCYAEHKGLKNTDFEIQLLYGMADPIAAAFKNRGYLTRLYIPLGEILPGMGYLVRRLLENTSNESFLKHTFFDQANIDTLIKKPEIRE